jgi:putative endonuclease
MANSPLPGPFHYVYILQSVHSPTHHYTGQTTRLAKHNSGGNPHTAAGAPWIIQTVIAFRNATRATAHSISKVTPAAHSP